MINFTVIIPCFNSSKTIARALDSLIDQTYSSFDVVLIDDASDDYAELVRIVEVYQSKLKISVIRNAINKNGAYARNKGIASAKNEYVAFLDADDSWVLTRLASAVDVINTMKKEHFIVYSQVSLIQNNETGAILPIRSIRANELVSEYVFAAGQPMQTSTFFCPLSTAKLVMFDESLSRHQDSDFMMRAQHQGIPIIYQDRVAAHYRINNVNVRSRVFSGRINSTFCLQFIENKKHFFNFKAISGYKLQIYARVLYIEGYLCRSYKVAFMALFRVGLINFFDLFRVKLLILLKSKLNF